MHASFIYLGDVDGAVGMISITSNQNVPDWTPGSAKI